MIIGVGLAGCAEVPIAKTNCWSGAGSNATLSTRSASDISRADTDAIACW